MSRILLVTPPYACWGVQVIGTWPPLHLAYLAGAAIDAGHEAKIYDAMNKKHSFEDVRAEIERYQPDLVLTLDYLPVTGAISTATVPAALKVLKIAKEVHPGIVTLIGGPHPSFMYDEILRDPDNHAGAHHATPSRARPYPLGLICISSIGLGPAVAPR